MLVRQGSSVLRLFLVIANVLSSQFKPNKINPSTSCIGLSTRRTFSIIFYFFQIQIFMVLQCFSYKNVFGSNRSGSKSFWSQKWQFLTIFFQFHYIKSIFYTQKQLVNVSETGMTTVRYLATFSTWVTVDQLQFPKEQLSW